MRSQDRVRLWPELQIPPKNKSIPNTSSFWAKPYGVIFIWIVSGRQFKWGSQHRVKFDCGHSYIYMKRQKIEYSKCCLICETNSMVWPLFWAVLNRRFKWGSQQRGRFWIKKAIMSTVYIIAVSICLFPNLGMMEFDLLIQIKSAFEPVCKCYFTKCSLLYKKVKQYSSVPLCFDKTWPLISQRLAPVTKACWK